VLLPNGKERIVKPIITQAAVCGFLLALGLAASAQEMRINVVAAENFYGDIAGQIAGERANIVSIISNPDQDPHLFETTPSVVRDITAARIVIVNGADYDAWMEKLLKASPQPGRTVITVADILGKKAGDNPHLWYAPDAAPAVATAIAQVLSTADPAHSADYANRLKTFISSLEPLRLKIAAVRAKYAGVPVTATEPVFGYMAGALKLEMRNGRFQLAIMNSTEPSASDVAAFERDLKHHKVRVLLYNKQASDKAVQRLVDLARASNIPVVGVTETAPPGVSYQDWMLTQLNDLEKALAGPSS
jgi:zinc/manganese transport system substrate-binding protein